MLACDWLETSMPASRPVNTETSLTPSLVLSWVWAGWKWPAHLCSSVHWHLGSSDQERIKSGDTGGWHQMSSVMKLSNTLECYNQRCIIAVDVRCDGVRGETEFAWCHSGVRGVVWVWVVETCHSVPRRVSGHSFQIQWIPLKWAESEWADKIFNLV